MAAPLDQLRTVDLGENIAGQYCCRLFADHGAEVILVEPADGSVLRRMPPFSPGTGESLLFAHLNAGKRSVVASPDALDRLLELADIVVVGPGRDGKALAEALPRAIVVSVTGFGTEGAYAGWHGSEMIYQALSSVMFNNGPHDRPPLFGTGHRASYATGIAAYAGALAALYERETSGRGQYLDISVAETAATMSTGPTAYNYSGRLDGGRGRSESLINCRGEWVLLWIYPFQWRDFCDALGLGPLVDDPRFATTEPRQANWAEFVALMQQRFADASADELVAKLQARRLITAKAASLTDLIGHDAHLRARAFWRRDGEGLRLRPPFRIGEAPR